MTSAAQNYQALSPHLQTRRTPQWLFDELNRQFGPFKLDAFASQLDHLCDNFYTAHDDGCVRDWVDVTFANPEFNDMARSLEQAARQGSLGRRSCVIGPVGCSQRWYHQFAIQGTIFIPDCRINFDMPDGAPTNCADRDTIVMVFGKQWVNSEAGNGIFRVQRLGIAHLRPARCNL